MVETAEEFIQRKEKEYKENKNKEIPFKDISRKGKFFSTREAWVFMPQSNLPEKVFLFERLRNKRTEGYVTHTRNKTNYIEYRFGYYIVGRIGNRKGKWTWGQYCPLIPIGDFKKLIQLARKKGVIL